MAVPLRLLSACAALTVGLAALPAAAAGAGGVAGAGGMGGGGSGGIMASGGIGGVPSGGGLEPGGGIGGRTGSPRDEGCSCELAGSPALPAEPALVGLLLLTVAWRRRR